MSKDEDFLNDTTPLKGIKMDVELVKTNIPNYPSQKLCEMIVCGRYLGFYPEISVLCMEELAVRRDAGDMFDFETYIDTTYQSLPKLDFTVPDLNSMLSTLVSAVQKVK
jgi:hypothetical protein